MKSRFAACVYAAAFAALVCAPGGAIAKNFHLKISHWVPPSHPLQKALENWAASVKKDSGGTITSTIYPSQQLGKAFDHYDMARDGIADLTFVSPGYQPGRFPVIAAAALPFLMSNATGGSVALDEWYRHYAAKEMKDVKFCLAFVHDPGAIHAVDKKITVPSDIKGMKIRPATGTIAEFVRLLGGTSVNAAAPEVRDVLARHVADAVTFPWGSIVLFGIDKVTKYHMEMPFYTTPFVLAFNKAKYNEMDAKQKKVIDDHCNSKWAEKIAAPWGKFEHDGIAKIKAEPGQHVYTISKAQVAMWRKAAEPLTAKWAAAAKKTGIDPDKALAELKADLKKENAAYQ